MQAVRPSAGGTLAPTDSARQVQLVTGCPMAARAPGWPTQKSSQGFCCLHPSTNLLEVEPGRQAGKMHAWHHGFHSTGPPFPQAVLHTHTKISGPSDQQTPPQTGGRDHHATYVPTLLAPPPAPTFAPRCNTLTSAGTQRGVIQALRQCCNTQ